MTRLAWLSALLSAAALLQRNLVAFLALLIISTVFVAGVNGGVPRSAFAAAAASDLLMALAATTWHSDSTTWQLPGRGQWGAGAALLAAAAVLRLAAGSMRASAGVGATQLIWWQGAYLAWLAAAGGRPVLVVAGLVTWGLLAAVRPARFSAAALFGSGSVMVMCALGVGLGAVAVAGLAAVAGTLGHRFAALVAVAPLAVSAIPELSLSRIGLSMSAGVAAVGIVGFATVVGAPAEDNRGRIPVLAALLLGMWTLLLEPGKMSWALYLLVVFGVAALVFTDPVGARVVRRHLDVGQHRANRAASHIGWCLELLAAALIGRLAWIGAATDFL